VIRPAAAGRQAGGGVIVRFCLVMDSREVIARMVQEYDEARRRLASA
jgi:hypothetical protein